MNKMNVPFVDLYAQYLTIKVEIDNAIKTTIENTSFIGGEAINQFEKSFSDLLGVEHVVSCANGTDSIEIILEAYGIGKGDEVIVPAISWISTSEAVGRRGATPVFVDVDKSGLIDVDKIEEKITPNTKMIIPVHLYGQAVNMDKIMSLSNKQDILVLEDCAQAHLAEWKGQKVGTIGHAASFSFYPGKNLGAYGDAGCMVLKDGTYAEICRMIANHGQKQKHDHHFEGRNSRLDGLQAAILNVKIPHIRKWTLQRIEVANWYAQALEGIDEIDLPNIGEGFASVYHLFVIHTSTRSKLQEFLKENGVMSAVHYPTPLPMLKPYIAANSENTFPIARSNSENILSLPLYPEMSKEQVEYVAKVIRNFYD